MIVPADRPLPAWADSAACLGLGTEPPPELCRTCPVQHACLDYALTTGVAEGMWGARNAAQRALLLRRAGGDPREALVAAYHQDELARSRALHPSQCGQLGLFDQPADSPDQEALW